MPKEGNFAFIDSQNIIQGVQSLDWKLDWLRFRRYLAEKYQVCTAILFLGYVPKNIYPYYRRSLDGFFLHFRKISYSSDGKIKGNVDVSLTLEVMRNLGEFNRAIIISSDGDFYPLVDYLYSSDKLRMIISPHISTCSRLLKQSARGRIEFMNDLKEKIAIK